MPDLEVPLLDELVLTVVVDNETDTLSSVDVGVAQLPEVVSLLERVPPSRHHDGHPGVCVFDQLCVACHGLSVLVTGRAGAEPRSLLFDVGPYADVWLDNATRLGVDLASIEVLFLSHWHADHSGGFPAVVEAIAAARAAAGRPPPVVDLHPDRPDQRGVQLANGTFALLPPEPTFAEIERAGGRIERHAEAHRVAELFVGSGLIERTTSYETGLVGHHTFVGDRGESDPLILDERFIAAHVRGRGVTVLSACSHAGIVNACLGAMALVPDVPVDTVLGGYHLAGAAMEPRIGATVEDLSALVRPRIVAPGHCTGWRAKAALANAFAPGRYGPSVVGSRYVLRADA
ncbi:MAG: MBL fold metallo-hydrolase [Acidimicrobiia bacterium]|nr:MBL fold metallo-hydrolase [Acidimicrobiia bacterium]